MNLSLRTFWATQLESRVLESLGVDVYANREGLKLRHVTQSREVTHLCRLVTEYNVLIGRLSPQEKGGE